MARTKAKRMAKKYEARTAMSVMREKTKPTTTIPVLVPECATPHDESVWYKDSHIILDQDL
jgi:hypothetical protein